MWKLYLNQLKFVFTIILVVGIISYPSFLANAQVSSEYDEITIFTSWDKSDAPLKVLILNSAGLSEYKISLVKKAIESETVYRENGVTYFEGWAGVIKSINSTKISNFEIMVSDTVLDADIVVHLTKIKGLQNDGFTQPRYNGDHIHWANVEIYDSNNLSFVELENIVRHEMGHALGLGHASSDWSMMYSSVYSVPKYITQCDIDGLRSLDAGIGFRTIQCMSV